MAGTDNLDVHRTRAYLVGDDGHDCSVPEHSPAEENKVPADEPVRLVGGVNFTTWPDLKWSRGNSHVALLESKFGEWQASAPISVDTVLRDDRLGIDLVARASKGVPKHEWSLDLGDALHNLRSAFDAVAWGMAHFNGAEPTRPRSVQFPICTDQKQWDKALKDWAGELPPDLQERIRIMQPFTFMPSGGVTLLSLLHALDVQDKHREILTVSVQFDGLNLRGSFEYQDRDVQAAPRLEMLSDLKFEDGVVLGTLHAGAPIRMLGRMILRPTVKLELVHEQVTYEVVQLLHALLTETRRCLDILLYGLASPDEQEGPGWAPMDVEPAGWRPAEADPRSE